MKETTKNILRKIEASSFKDPRELACILFSDTMYSHRAIFIMPDSVIFLFPEDTDLENKKIFYQEIIELLEWLEYLEDEHLIYVGDNTKELKHLYYKGATMFSMGQIESEYNIGTNLILNVLDGKASIAYNGKCILSGDGGPNYLYEKFRHFFSSIIYPTISLSNFVKNDFLTEEQLNINKSLNLARWGVWISLFVATLSPIVTVWISNEFGISTLNSDQYNKLIEGITRKGDTCAIRCSKEVIQLRSHSSIPIVKPDCDSSLHRDLNNPETESNEK